MWILAIERIRKEPQGNLKAGDNFSTKYAQLIIEDVIYAIYELFSRQHKCLLFAWNNIDGDFVFDIFSFY